MNTLKLIVVSLFISLLMACGGDPDNSAEEQGAIPKHQLKALNKADSIENSLLEAEERRNKQMEEQGL